MGTRSLTVVREDAKTKKDIIVMYRQYDGYPSGHGAELAKFLAPFTIMNGISGKVALGTHANGAECLAAQVVAHFKTDVGGIYLSPSGTRDAGEEYIYTVYPHEGRVWLRVQGGAVTYFGLPGTKQANMPVIWEGAAAEFDAESAETAYKKLSEDIPNDFVEGEKAKAATSGKRKRAGGAK